MNNWLYHLYFIIIGIVSFFTGEIVTFIMLTFIFISLNNINRTLQKLLQLKTDECNGTITK